MNDDGGGGGGGLRRPVRWSPRMNGERRQNNTGCRDSLEQPQETMAGGDERVCGVWTAKKEEKRFE